MDNNLESQVSILISEFLVRDTRRAYRKSNLDIQAQAMASMVDLESLTNVFDKNAHEKSTDLYGLDEYRSRLRAIFNRFHERDVESLDLFKHRILAKAFSEVLRSNQDEAEIKSLTRKEIEYRNRIFELEEKIKYQKLNGKVSFLDRLNSAVNFPYLVVLLLIIAMLVSLVILGLTTEISISVDFSVGEIIGALLVGTGVAAAGISYATKKDRNEARPE
ncbi:hypothetical protein PRZ61_12060 [Halomonas pacifica]|uniref:hypothetical protein n=1 Tax=Bisbaumannia pacifica TaxID=77098 RepID=UPI002359CDA1|nr:hypothetical protein [Halomonas pacifica]MDC8804176.1 hypothetical protein [Halomonas pacifica]